MWMENLLFETRLGEWLLAQFERRTGLAIVRTEWLSDQEISPILPDNRNGTQRKEAETLPLGAR